MMRAYEINSGRYQRHIVIAHTIADAERIYNKKYGYGQAEKIEVIADYVEVQGIDDKEVKA